MAPEERIGINGEDGIVAARQHARALARSLGFGLVDQSRIATAVSELTRNVVRYATGGQGEVTIRALAGSARGAGIEIVVADRGPGIANLDLVLKGGVSSSAGLGLGLSGTRRLMDEMEIDSTVGSGTVITVRKWRH